MLSFLASLLSSRTLPESLQFGLSLPMASVPGPTQTQSSSSSPSLLYPLRSQLLCLLIPAKGSLVDSHETLRLAPLSKIPTRYAFMNLMCVHNFIVLFHSSTPVSLLASILVGLTQRSCGCAQLPSLKQLYLHSK